MGPHVSSVEASKREAKGHIDVLDSVPGASVPYVMMSPLRDRLCPHFAYEKLWLKEEVLLCEQFPTAISFPLPFCLTENVHSLNCMP